MKHISKSWAWKQATCWQGRSGTHHSRCTKEVFKRVQWCLATFNPKKLRSDKNTKTGAIFLLMQRFNGCKEWQRWCCWPVFFARNNEKQNVLYQKFQVLGIYWSCDMFTKTRRFSAKLLQMAVGSRERLPNLIYGELRSSDVEIWREN